MTRQHRQAAKRARRKARVASRVPGSAAHKRTTRHARVPVVTEEQVDEFVGHAIEREQRRLRGQVARLELGSARMQNMVNAVKGLK